MVFSGYFGNIFHLTSNASDTFLCRIRKHPRIGSCRRGCFSNCLLYTSMCIRDSLKTNVILNVSFHDKLVDIDCGDIFAITYQPVSYTHLQRVQSIAAIIRIDMVKSIAQTTYYTKPITVYELEQ